jgi:hypothetical protein
MDYDVVGVLVLLLFVTTDHVQLVISARVMISSSVDFHTPHHCRCFDDHHQRYDYVSVWQHYVTLSVSSCRYYHHVMSTYSYSVLLPLLQQNDYYYHGYDDVD